VNLLRDNLDEQGIAAILAGSPRGPLLPPIGHEKWAIVAANPTIQQWLAPLRLLAEKEIDRPLPELTDDLYREFHASGVRLPFESVYFERRRRLARAGICALVARESDRGPWLESFTSKLREVFNEFSWAMPAHVNLPSGKDPSHIDLFVAETANLIAEAIDLFGPFIPADLLQQMQWRLRILVWENYTNRHEDFFWPKGNNNWNAVCHQGVIGSALAFCDDDALLARMLATARRYLPLYLKGFGPDGGCSEGPGYWQYGFGWFAVLNQQLETRTGGVLSLFENDPHVVEIAKYGPRVTLANYQFVNFSDSPRTGALNPWLLTYLGTRLGDDVMLAHGYRSYQRMDQTGINLQGQRTDLFHLVRLLLNVPTDAQAERGIEMEDVMFRDMGVLIAHGRDEHGNLWDFAAKAGHNAEHHNHNDCGSYILNIQGKPLVIEIGAPEYTKDFFREHRYQYLAARTLGHSLPIINGCEQAAGPQYAARVLNHELAEDHVEFSVELTACYPPAAHCTVLVRSFYFDKLKGCLRVKESYELTKHDSFETSVIAEELIEQSGERAAVIGGILIVRPFEDTVFAGIEEQEYRDHSGVPRKVYRLIMKPSNLAAQHSIGYELRLE
jgi:hypothetical protein